ncbi:MAG: hypothetical protein ACLQPD_04450 [Desulfomonilaceae bacterium]
MSRLNPDIIYVQEAEEVLEATIQRGESLLQNGVDHFSDVMSWLNLAGVSLEFVPSCQRSFNLLCLDERSTNRQIVETGLSILRDALTKIHSLVYFNFNSPSEEYQALVRFYSGEGLMSDGFYVW